MEQLCQITTVLVEKATGQTRGREREREREECKQIKQRRRRKGWVYMVLTWQPASVSVVDERLCGAVQGVRDEPEPLAGVNGL